MQEGGESALRSFLTPIQISHDHAVSSSGVIQTEPPGRSESFAFRTCSWKSFVHVFLGGDWGSGSWILHDWCSPDATTYQLLWVSVALEPYWYLCWTLRRARLVCDFGRMCEVSVELSLLADSACNSRRNIGNSDNHKIYAFQNAEKWILVFLKLEIHDILTQYERYNEPLVSGRFYLHLAYKPLITQRDWHLCASKHMTFGIRYHVAWPTIYSRPESEASCRWERDPHVENREGKFWVPYQISKLSLF